MRRRILICFGVSLALISWEHAWGQSSIDALAAELKAAKVEHDAISSQALDAFFAQVDAGMQSPDAALTLYQAAGGTMPDPTPVVTEHVSETPSEKAARVAVDDGNLARLGNVVQMQCAMLHFGALYVTKPDQAGLGSAWASWLKSASSLYLQTALPAQDTDSQAAEPSPNGQAPGGQQHHHKRDKTTDFGTPAGPKHPPFDISGLKGQQLKDTAISRYLGFHWKDSDQGGWSVQAVPALYHSVVLEPLRTTPTTATLEAWDAYIAMANADERNTDRWNSTVYPPLLFDRTCDSYAVTPTSEILESLVSLIKANQSNPAAGDWLARTDKLLEDYKTRHGGGAVASANTSAPTTTPTTDPNVTVTTAVQGDMTIVTTHTNAPAAAPPAPAP